jgi:hypothetical protein
MIRWRFAVLFVFLLSLGLGCGGGPTGPIQTSMSKPTTVSGPSLPLQGNPPNK